VRRERRRGDQAGRRGEAHAAGDPGKAKAKVEPLGENRRSQRVSPRRNQAKRRRARVSGREEDENETDRDRDQRNAV
jgi:hypothetical protein